MKRQNRTRPRYTPTVEVAEARALLSLAVPAPAAVRALEFSFVPAIHGTIYGTVTSVTPVSPTSEIVSYSGHGKANIIGDGSGTGQQTITSQHLRNGSTRDIYRNGSTMIQGTTDLVSVHYTGAGRTNPNGSFMATLHGTARSVAGLDAGLSGSFVAQISGNSRTGPFTIRFTIRV